MEAFQQTVNRLMKNNIQIEKTEKILVLTDRTTENLAKKFNEALKNDGWTSTFYMMEDRSKSGEEPPKEAAELMLRYRLVFCLTRHSLTHTVARKEANAKGVSVITMPGITEDMFLQGAMSADYSRVEEETVAMAEKLTAAKSVTILTGEANKLVIPIKGRQGIASTGVFRETSTSGNLPSGEAYIAPLEGMAEGSIEINGSIAGIGLLNEAITLTIEQGKLIHATGEKGKKLLALLGEEQGRLLAELGIGTNYKARLTGNILEDEKAYHTVHVAFGSNHTFGGTIHADVHIDCVIKDPKLDWE